MNNNPLVSVVVLTWNKEEQALRCVGSILDSSYKNIQVIVVDNNSVDNTCEKIFKNYPQVKLIRNKINLFASEGRNIGVSYAKGDYILFVDNDNVIDKDMISELVKVAINDKKIGLLGPKMYYLKNKKLIWYAGAVINLITSRTKYIGINSIDNGQFDLIKETGHIPNVIMAKKAIFEIIEGFDAEKFPMHYEEADIAEKIKRKGYKVLFVPKAITYHDTPINIWENSGKGFALNDENRTYFNFRNRILFMKMYGKNYTLFILVFLPIFTFLYALIALKLRRPKLIVNMILGIKEGIFKKV